jgi:hypothetical protein
MLRVFLLCRSSVGVLICFRRGHLDNVLKITICVWKWLHSWRISGGIFLSHMDGSGVHGWIFQQNRCSSRSLTLVFRLCNFVFSFYVCVYLHYAEVGYNNLLWIVSSMVLIMNNKALFIKETNTLIARSCDFLIVPWYKYYQKVELQSMNTNKTPS